tara:strand:- start:83 stop:724 length:642 start_codon:yes stop_codon:yes gene_type:complete
MKHKLKVEDEHGISWDAYKNQDDNIIWQDSLARPGHLFSERQVEYLIMVTNFKDRSLDKVDLEKLNSLMHEIYSLCLGMNNELYQNHKEPDKIHKFRQTFINLSANDKNLVAEHLGIEKADLTIKMETLTDYLGKGRPPADYLTKLRELIFDRISRYIHQRELVVPRDKFTSSGLLDFYKQTFSRFYSIENNILFSDDKKVNRFIESSLDKID